MDEIISYKMCAVKVRNAKLRNYLKCQFLRAGLDLISSMDLIYSGGGSREFVLLRCLISFVTTRQGRGKLNDQLFGASIMLSHRYCAKTSSKLTVHVFTYLQNFLLHKHAYLLVCFFCFNHK